MRVWITGMSGFLGGKIYESLKGHVGSISGNDNFSCSTDFPDSANLIRRIDCCDFDHMRSALGEFEPDVLVHCAALAHEGLSNFSPSIITNAIYQASVTTFSAAIASGVKRIVFMSSMARYGEQSLPFHEAMTPRPVDPYGIAKVAAEDTLKALCKLHGVEYVIAVPHNIIGPRQRYNDPYRNVASIMINRALQGKSIMIYGDGQQKRCFSPIKDCLHSLTKMIDAPISGETINIGPDHGEMTIYNLARTIQFLTGNTVKIEHMADRPNEVKEAYCTSSKAKRLLDFKAQQDITSCLAEMVAYIRERGTKEFSYSLPLEIENGCPETWKSRLI